MEGVYLSGGFAPAGRAPLVSAKGAKAIFARAWSFGFLRYSTESNGCGTRYRSCSKSAIQQGRRQRGGRSVQCNYVEGSKGTTRLRETAPARQGTHAGLSAEA